MTDCYFELDNYFNVHIWGILSLSHSIPKAMNLNLLVVVENKPRLKVKRGWRGLVKKSCIIALGRRLDALICNPYVNQLKIDLVRPFTLQHLKIINRKVNVAFRSSSPFRHCVLF